MNKFEAELERDLQQAKVIARVMDDIMSYFNPIKKEEKDGIQRCEQQRNRHQEV